MIQVFSIGAIIKANAGKAMIVGYCFLPDGDGQRLAYVVVPYPSGYQSAQKLRVVPADGVEMIEQGYEAPGVDMLLRYIGGVGAIAEKCAPEMLGQIMKQAAEAVKEEVLHG